MRLTEREERLILACFEQDGEQRCNFRQAGITAGFNADEANDLAISLHNKGVFAVISYGDEIAFTAQGRETARELLRTKAKRPQYWTDEQRGFLRRGWEIAGPDNRPFNHEGAAIGARLTIKRSSHVRDQLIERGVLVTQDGATKFTVEGLAITKSLLGKPDQPLTTPNTGDKNEATQPCPNAARETEQSAIANAKAFMVQSGSLGLPYRWALPALPGTVLDRSELEQPGVDLQRLADLKAIRPATDEEVDQFAREHPIDSDLARRHVEKTNHLRASLDERQRRAVKLSAKAALCLDLIRELVDAENNCRQLWDRLGETRGMSARAHMSWIVSMNRQLRNANEICRMLKAQISDLAQPLMVAAESLPDLPATPLLTFTET